MAPGRRVLSVRRQIDHKLEVIGFYVPSHPGLPGVEMIGMKHEIGAHHSSRIDKRPTRVALGNVNLNPCRLTVKASPRIS